MVTLSEQDQVLCVAFVREWHDYLGDIAWRDCHERLGVAWLRLEREGGPDWRNAQACVRIHWDKRLALRR